MSIDFELLLRKGRDLIAQGKINCEASEAAIGNSRKILAAISPTPVVMTVLTLAAPYSMGSPTRIASATTARRAVTPVGIFNK